MTDINSLSRHAFQPTEEPNNAAGHQARIKDIKAHIEALYRTTEGKDRMKI